MRSRAAAGAGRARRLLALALLAAVGYALLARYDAPRGPAGAWLARHGLTAHEAQVAGRRVRYVRAGSGPGLVLVHGFASSVFTWSELLPDLARTHAVVALDLPGFGASDMPADLAWPDLPRAVSGLMDHLGLRRATLVGHSLGGAVVVTLAATSPERVQALVLIDSAGFNVDPQARPALVSLAASPALGAVADHVPVRRALVGLGLRQVFHDRTRLTPERVDEYLHPLRRREFLPAMRSLLSSRQDELRGFAELLPRVSAPTLLLWGREDVWAPVEQAARFQAGLPAARLVVFPSCGHVPQEERPADTLRELRAFLATSPHASAAR
jgi:pimeloyl-ACP methyl ester carboxylesterase